MTNQNELKERIKKTEEFLSKVDVMMSSKLEDRQDYIEVELMQPTRLDSRFLGFGATSSLSDLSVYKASVVVDLECEQKCKHLRGVLNTQTEDDDSTNPLLQQVMQMLKQPHLVTKDHFAKMPID